MGRMDEKTNNACQRKKVKYDECKEKLTLKKVVLTESFDFFPLIPISSDIIVSENLKQAIEENGITGFEFFEIDYEVVAE